MMPVEPPLIPGVDYEVSTCPICGSADPDMSKHQDCMEALNAPYPPRGYPHHDDDDPLEAS